MIIKRTSSLKAQNRIEAKTANRSVEAEPENAVDPVTDVIVKGAYASGGALAGVGLGVVTGGVLAGLTGTPSLTTVGGVLGAIGGAGSAVSMADSENKVEVLGQLAAGWGGASLGAGIGQVVVGGSLTYLATGAGYQTLAASAPLLGTAAGAVVGASVAGGFVGDQRAILKKAGHITGWGTAGLLLGTAARAVLAGAPGTAHMLKAAPVVGTAAGLAIGNVNGSTEPGDLAYGAAKATGLGALGYGGGAVLGSILHFGFGGHSAYTVMLPAAIGLSGGLLGYSTDFSGKQERSKLQESALIGGSALLQGTAGLAAGDFLGSVLSEATGNSLHHPIATAMGMTLGAVNGLEMAGLDTRGATIVGAGTSAGFGLGAIVGKGLTTLTGDGLYEMIGAGVGAANGALVALEGNGMIDSSGAVETLAGVTLGGTVGTLMGAALDTLTGQAMWGVALPVLGSAAGGLTALASSRLARAEENKGDDTAKSA